MPAADSYRRRLNRIVWAYGGRLVYASPEWTDRAAWRSRMARAEVHCDNHGATADRYRDRLATYLPELRAAP